MSIDIYQAIVYILTVFVLVVGSSILGPVVFLALVAFAVVALVAWTIAGSERYRSRRPDPRFRPTDEVFADPGHRGRMTRVYVDPETGERAYVPDR